jgi:hypothetical protein
VVSFPSISLAPFFVVVVCNPLSQIRSIGWPINVLKTPGSCLSRLPKKSNPRWPTKCNNLAYILNPSKKKTHLSQNHTSHILEKKKNCVFFFVAIILSIIFVCFLEPKIAQHHL